MPSQKMNSKQLNIADWVKLVVTKKMDEKDFSAAILKFSARFINELEKDKSVVSSPLSAEFVLALLTLGANDPAHAELLTALGIPYEGAVRTSFSNLTSKLKSVNGVKLNVANKVYIKRGLELEPHLQKDAGKVFGTEAEEMDFTDSSAAECINKWVESRTNIKIKDIIADDILDNTTQLVLVNAAYFKGTWRNSFKSERTREAPFYVDANSTIAIPIMSHSSHYYKYGRSDLGEVLVLPYEGDQASMVFVLPNEIDGVNSVLEKLAGGYDFLAEVDGLEVQRVQVSIPKFEVETEINLREILPKLGIKSVFNPGIDKMLKKKKQSVRVSLAVQKVIIEVNEDGMEATAYKARRMPLKKPPHFIANRPFVYLLTGPERATLCMGVYRGDGSEPCAQLPKWSPPTLRWEKLISSYKSSP